MKNEALDKQMTSIMNRTVLFTNIAEFTFTCQWDMQPFTFRPGETRFMEYWRARHFGKHLVNQMLADESKYPNGANSQSPKDENGKFKDPIFQGLFMKVVKELDAEGRVAEDELIDVNKRQDDAEALKSERKLSKKELEAQKKQKKEEKKAEEDDEEEFGGIQQVYDKEDK